MTSTAEMTILKMIEALPEQLQDRVVEHVRDYIEEMRDEAQWDDLFSRTKESLAATAQQARKEISEGKAIPLDIDNL
jgi:hypothetical protein